MPPPAPRLPCWPDIWLSRVGRASCLPWEWDHSQSQIIKKMYIPFSNKKHAKYSVLPYQSFLLCQAHNYDVAPEVTLIGRNFPSFGSGILDSNSAFPLLSHLFAIVTKSTLAHFSSYHKALWKPHYNLNFMNQALIL